MACLPAFISREPTHTRTRTSTTTASFKLSRTSTTNLSDFFRNSVPSTSSPHPLPILATVPETSVQMEKMLSKSRSRYFFGKKKSPKNQGISSSDAQMVGSEGKGESFNVASTSTTPHATPRMFPGGASVMMISGPRMPHAGPSSAVTAERAASQTDSPKTPPSTSTRSFQPGTSSQSRFEVHINPTTFSPIVIPPSTAQRPVDSPSASPSKRNGFLPIHSKEGVDAGAEYSRTGAVPAHTRSQSTVTPDQTSIARTKLRRHAMPVDFMESIGITTGETNAWNGQSLGAERYMSNHTLRDASSSSFSRDPALVRPSASAPATSCLAKTDTSAAVPELAPLRESSTEPSMLHSSFSSQAHSPLPRSSPSYNLAALIPPSSGTPAPSRAPGGALPPFPGAHRGPPPPPPRDVESRPHRAPPPLPSLSPITQPGASTTTFQLPPRHRSSPSVNSETEIGFKGLAFPLPPSSEEGLAMSYSSSQSSLFSVGSERKSGEHPNTPKKTRETKHRGEEDRDVRTSRSAGSHGTGPSQGRGVRDRSISVGASEGRTSPTTGLGTLGKWHEHLTRPTIRRNAANTSGTDADGEWTIRNMQAHIAKELEDALGVNTEDGHIMDGASLAVQSLAASEAPQANHTPALRPQTQPPKSSEPTKPLSLAAGRKTLHTMRSVATGLSERKQLHASTSHRELSASLKNVNGRMECVRTVTDIPLRTGLSRAREVPGSLPMMPSQPPPDAKLPLPPATTLPTPPNSSSALTFLAAGETKSSVLPPPRPSLPLGPGPRPTLEDVTNALRTQRVRFDELAGYVLDVAQQHAAEQDAYAGRVGRLEGALVKMEREIRGLRWLVLEHAKSGGDGGGVEKRLRRSSTMPHLPPPSPPGDRRGLGLDFSPDSARSSPSTLSPPRPVSSLPQHVEEAEVGECTPSMDDIIDKLMAVRQWAGADVRVSVVEGVGVGARDGGDSKRIVFREG